MYEITLALDADEARTIERIEAVADHPPGTTDARATLSHVFQESPEAASVGRVDDA